MKNKLFLALILIFSSIILSSCGDIIEEPYINVKEFDTTQTTNRKVLLEDYTGFTCGNCPAAHELAAEINKSTNGKVIVMAVHAGGYAKTSTKHPYDFTIPAGVAYDEFFGVSKVGNPMAMINRMGYSTGQKNHLLVKTKWQKYVDSALAQPSKIELTLSSVFKDTNQTANIELTIKYLSVGSKDLNWNLYFTEDSIINYQLDYRKTPIDIEDYVHMHVLRDVAKGTWGEQISLKEVAAGSIIKKTHNFKIPSGKDFVAKNMRVIAVISNSANYEILQVEEVKLK